MPEARNVLLLADAHDAACEECDDLLRVDGGSVAELRVSFTGGDPSVHASEAGDRHPESKGLISVGDSVRSADAAAADFSGPTTVDAVEDPTDLQGLGIAISEFCEQWEAHEISVCFDSLTRLLEHTEPDTVFRFAHVLTNRLDSVDAVAHFHLDPGAHDDSVVATFGSIFDGTIDPDPEAGEGEVETRISQASDEEIARLARDWDDGAYAIADPDGDGDGDEEDGGDGGITEATDEDIAEALPD